MYHISKYKLSTKLTAPVGPNEFIKFQVHVYTTLEEDPNIPSFKNEVDIGTWCQVPKRASFINNTLLISYIILSVCNFVPFLIIFDKTYRAVQKF